jgi:DNA-binding NarL/FixJ family response regulator
VLTARQTTVLSLVADGLGNAAIARELAVSQHTVKNVLYEVMGRLQASNRSHAVARAVKAGIV